MNFDSNKNHILILLTKNEDPLEFVCDLHETDNFKFYSFNRRL